MKKILYRAINEVGDKKSGFVNAGSNKDALQILKGQGYTNIKLHDDSSTAFQRKDLDGLSDRELERIAKLEIKARRRASLTTCLLETIRVNWIIIAIGLGIFCWGYADHREVLSIVGLITALSMPLLTLWNYRAVAAYNNLLNAFAIGSWTEARKFIDQLRPKVTFPEMAFDLDVREACILAGEGHLTAALRLVEKWEKEFDLSSPGTFESRIAPIYHAAGNYEGFLEQMKNGHLKSTGSPVLMLDLALAEARFGEVKKAALLLGKINLEELPPHGVPYINWVKGLIGDKNGDPASQNHLAMAVSGFLEYGDNPAVLTSLALCSGSYAYSLLRHGNEDGAKSVIKRIWPILKVHGDNSLVERLEGLVEVEPIKASRVTIGSAP